MMTEKKNRSIRIRGRGRFGSTRSDRTPLAPCAIGRARPGSACAGPAPFRTLPEGTALLPHAAAPRDVPGWVMIPVMPAALVVALRAIAAPKLTDAFSHAISSVSG